MCARSTLETHFNCLVSALHRRTTLFSTLFAESYLNSNALGISCIGKLSRVSGLVLKRCVRWTSITNSVSELCEKYVFWYILQAWTNARVRWDVTEFHWISCGFRLYQGKCTCTQSVQWTQEDLLASGFTKPTYFSEIISLSEPLEHHILANHCVCASSTLTWITIQLAKTVDAAPFESRSAKLCVNAGLKYRSLASWKS